MFTSIQKGLRPALPALSAMILMLSGNSPAAAATVVSTAHYQAQLTLNCNGGTLCNGWFPSVAARRRLQLTRVTCNLRSANYAVFASGQIDVRTVSTNTVSQGQYLAVDHTTEWGYHVINNAVAVQIAAGQQFSVSLFLVQGSGVVQTASCTAHGTLEVLQ